MKKIAILLVDYTLEREKGCKITIVPKGTVLFECHDGGMFSTYGDGEGKPKHKMTIGCNFVYKNTHIFKVEKVK